MLLLVANRKTKIKNNQNNNPKQKKALQFVENGKLPSDSAVTFVDNHDTQREGALSYKEGFNHNIYNNKKWGGGGERKKNLSLRRTFRSS